MNMRVLSKKVSENLLPELIEIIWDFYDDSYINVIMDEYQFFTIKTYNEITTLVMRQEIPEAIKVKKISRFPDTEIWIIKDGEIETMLFPEDY